MDVYLIMNECTVKGSDMVLTEFVSVHSTLQKALDALNEIAREDGDEIGPDETNIYVATSHPFETEEYYIQSAEVDKDER